MTHSSGKSRIIFIDLIRAFAVLNMVQGHTIDVLLNDNYRTFDSIFFSIWTTNRGLTAPLFLFSSGTVFTYLFRIHQEPFKKNPRVKKGLKRILLLICLGYLMRFPTPYMIYFKDIAPERWQVFFSVDVLQLIGFGLFFILMLCFVSEKFHISDYIIFSAASILNISLYPLFESINWSQFLHPFFAGYFYKGTGSNFPLFPWLSYIFAGAIFGSFIAKNQNVFKSKKATVGLFIIGISLILISIAGDFIEIIFYHQSNYWTSSPNLIFFRLAIVVIETSIFTFIAIKLETIPRILILLGRNTLVIYIIHLVILYGSPWTLGINSILNKSFNLTWTLYSAFAMAVLMMLLVYFINYFSMKNKSLET